MKVLITGGAGYIGTGLVDQLVSGPKIKKIVIYDNLSRENYSFFLGGALKNSEKLSFVEGDILDSRKLRKHLQGVDVVIHLEYEEVPYYGTIRRCLLLLLFRPIVWHFFIF